MGGDTRVPARKTDASPNVYLRKTEPVPSPGTGWLGEGGGYSFAVCLSRMTIGHAGRDGRVRKIPPLPPGSFVAKVQCISSLITHASSMVLPRFFRTKEDINLEALPTKEGMQVGVLLFRPDNQRVLGLKTAADARTLFQVCGCVCNSSRGVPKQQ